MDICSRDYKPLLTVAEALARMMSSIRPIQEAEIVGLGGAMGRMLASTLVSPINIPSDRNSAMDGYALMSHDIQDSPFQLEIIGTASAGKPFQGKILTGQCVRIFTGAVAPVPADTVIMQEQVHTEGGIAYFQGGLKPGQNIRAAGEDVRENTPLLPAGKKLLAGDLALLAAAGIGDVPVTKRLRVIHFSTGDELVAVGGSLASGKIYDSNRYLLHAALAQPAYQVTDGGILADDPKLLQAKLGAAAQDFDAIITTGGASVGEADYVKDVLARLGRVDFWKIAIKPGKPMAYGQIGRCHFFGLPGNPVSVMVTFQQLVVPALKKLSGAADHLNFRMLATCTSTLEKSPGREEFQRGFLSQDVDGGLQVRSTGKQGSNILSSLAAANCLVVLPAECAGVMAGDRVVVEPIWAWFQ